MIAIIQKIEELSELVSQLQAGERGLQAGEPMLLAMAEEEFETRLIRPELFGRMLQFGEPGWDILLDLYLAEANNRRLSSTSAGVIAGVRSTTIHRWLDILQDEGLIDRTPDQSDRRRNWIDLTDKGRSLMQQYLRERIKRRQQSLQLALRAPFETPPSRPQHTGSDHEHIAKD